ncbi:MAG: hypothetical protein U9P14_00975 [Gemmatimonadota bacterium]|nr:hypothetical protein [Gemmatimonadota bacterium]
MRRYRCLIAVSFSFMLLVLSACTIGTGEKKACLPAAGAKQSESAEDFSLPGEVTGQREAWVNSSLAWVEETLTENTPGNGNPALRKLALTTLDDPLHLVDAPRMKAVGCFFHRMIGRALDRIETEQVTSAAVVWKLYNHAFVIRTSGHTFAYDIFRGVEEVSMTEEQLGRLADVLEVLFISHFHRDHADYGFAELMVERGKKVVVPEDLWRDKPIADSLVRVPGGTAGEVAGIKFIAFDGHQGMDIPNNVYLVTADGFSVMQTGDQSNREDFDRWIDGLGEKHHVDVLLPNCWTTDLPRMIREVNPRVVITGHENELGHTVDHRESFTKTYRHLRQVEHPYIVMGWGERFSLLQ